MNNEEAQRALDIARRHEQSGNYETALRFARKAVSLSNNTLPHATALVSKLESLSSSSASASTSTSANPTASTSSSNPNPASSSRPQPRSNAAPTKEKAKDDKPREYTKAQLELVQKVKKCKITDYYGILSIEKGCDDSAVKKAYRKLALGLHPDKCGAPGAEEAFKMVSKAFQVLSDPSKRSMFDQTGSDPDSRGGGGGGGSAGFPAGFGGGGRRGGGEELSPEDLFNMFFGGGAGMGGGFGGGGFQSGFYGPGGMRFTTMNMGGQRRPQNAGGNGGNNNSSPWVQLLPLLLLFGFSVLSQLPSFFFGSTPDPDFTFSPSTRYSTPRTTSGMGVEYYVNPQQFSSHPIYTSVVNANPSTFTSSHSPGSNAYKQDLYSHLLSNPTISNSEGGHRWVIPKELSKFEKTVERTYIHRMQQRCQNEIDDRQERIDRARGFLGIGADWDKVREITNAKLEHCERLSELGYRVQY